MRRYPQFNSTPPQAKYLPSQGVATELQTVVRRRYRQFGMVPNLVATLPSLGAVGGATYNASLTESASASDALATTLTALNALTEAAVAGESLATLVTALNTITEMVSVADSYVDAVGGTTYTVSLTESVSAIDAYSASGFLIVSAERTLLVRAENRSLTIPR